MEEFQVEEIHGIVGYCRATRKKAPGRHRARNGCCTYPIVLCEPLTAVSSLDTVCTRGLLVALRERSDQHEGAKMCEREVHTPSLAVAYSCHILPGTFGEFVFDENNRR